MQNEIFHPYTTFSALKTELPNMMRGEGNNSIFTLVLDAWAMLGSAFVALLVINVLNYKTTQLVEVLMILTGLDSFIACSLLGVGTHICCAAPGILSGFIPFLIAAALGKAHKVK